VIDGYSRIAPIAGTGFDGLAELTKRRDLRGESVTRNSTCGDSAQVLSMPLFTLPSQTMVSARFAG
jgi:hypothetical protein